MAKTIKFSGDPFAKGTLEDTLTERKRQYQSLVNVVHAMDGEVQAKIAEELMKGTDDTTPNYDLINRRSKDYDSKKVKSIIQIIKDHYSVKNKLSPFRKAIDDAKLDETSRKLVENIYHGHKDKLIRAVGQAKYGQQMRALQDENQKEVQSKILSSAAAGYNAHVHGDDVIAHLMDSYKIDRKDVDIEQLKRVSHELIPLHIAGELKADTIYNSAPKYKKKRKAA